MKGYRFYEVEPPEGIANYTWVVDPSNQDGEYPWEETVDTALSAIEKEVVRRNLKSPQVQNVSHVTLGHLSSQDRMLAKNLALLKKYFSNGVAWEAFEKNLWPGYVAILGPQPRSTEHQRFEQRRLHTDNACLHLPEASPLFHIAKQRDLVHHFKRDRPLDVQFMFERNELEAFYVTGTQQFFMHFLKLADDVKVYKVPGVTIKEAPSPEMLLTSATSATSASSNAASAASAAAAPSVIRKFEVGTPVVLATSWTKIGEYAFESGIFYDQAGEASAKVPSLHCTCTHPTANVYRCKLALPLSTNLRSHCPPTPPTHVLQLHQSPLAAAVPGDARFQAEHSSERGHAVALGEDGYCGAGLERMPPASLPEFQGSSVEGLHGEARHPQSTAAAAMGAGAL